MSQWSLTSWKTFPYRQAAHYSDENHLDRVVKQLSVLPPLVSRGEIDSLKLVLAQAADGKAFVLQGGDCAELFSDCRPEIICNKLKILLQMSLILLYGIRKPIVRIGRIAGQYAKPRSSDDETIDGISLPSYRGDFVNSPEFNLAARTPNPDLLLQGYSFAAMTLNYIRALVDGGFADLHHPQRWDLAFVAHSPQAEEYLQIVESVNNALEFLQSIDGVKHSSLGKVNFFTSHEALHLHYEQALTRQLEDGRWYNLSTHLPWVGLRTASIDGAHIELLRGVQNPIGIKIGPNTSADTLLQLLQSLNPEGEEGKILLISRMGATKIRDYLPQLIDCVLNCKIPVTWSCDPMHGNTETTAEGIKTRHFDNILLELQHALAIHHQMGSHLGGVHFELTGENVTECIGGARGLNASDLKNAYHSLVDPRLNYEQSLEMAIKLSQQIQDIQKS